MFVALLVQSVAVATLAASLSHDNLLRYRGEEGRCRGEEERFRSRCRCRGRGMGRCRGKEGREVWRVNSPWWRRRE